MYIIAVMYLLQQWCQQWRLSYEWACFQLYLDLLPEDKSQWIKKTKELRAQYEQIKERVSVCTVSVCVYDHSWHLSCKTTCFLPSFQHITNPRKAAGQQDLVVNNPLSQDEGVKQISRGVLFFPSGKHLHVLFTHCAHFSLSRVCGTSSSRIKSCGVWSSRTCWERECVILKKAPTH